MTVKTFLRRHKEGEEVAAAAIGINLLWQTLAAVGLVGAGWAAAAVLSSSTYHPNYSLSTKGAAFLTRNEGLRLWPYNDPYNCTVGVGHLIHYGRCSSGDYSRWRVTYSQAMTMLMHDSGWASRCVNGRITRPITQYQADALIDLAFNAGCGSLDYSGIARTINGGGTLFVPHILAHTAVTADGHYLPGLYQRRLAEGSLYSRGYYGYGIGFYTRPTPKLFGLRARTGYWSWLAWYLGEGKWRRYKPATRQVRPHVPARIPHRWWRLEQAFLKARRHA